MVSLPAGRWWLAFAAVAAVLLLPLSVCEIPPLLDYPNHLARMEILAHGAAYPALSRIYRVEWHILPNIGIDALMPLMMRLLPLAWAGKLFLAAALLLPVAGVAALHRALFRVRSLWPLAAALFAYNRLFFAGFMNFLIGAGLALLAAAIWEAGKEDKAVRRVAIAAVAAIVIFFCHLIALAFYGLLLASLELARAYALGRLDPRRLDFVRLGLLAVPFLIPAYLYLHAPIADAGESTGHGIVEFIRHYYWQMMGEPVGLKPYGLLGPVLSYNRALDGVCLAIVVAFIAWARWKRYLRVAAAPLGLMVCLLIAYPLVPFTMLGTGWIDQRLPILAGYLMFAATCPSFPTPRLSHQVAAILVAALLARTAEIAHVWSGRDAQLEDFRAVIAPISPGDRILVVQAEDSSSPDSMSSRPDSARSMMYNDATMHLAGLAVIERHAFWPLLFSAPTKQPVKVLPPYSELSLFEGVPPRVGSLPDPLSSDLQSAPYLSRWRDFDWVLVLWPGWTPGGYTLPDLLEPVTAGHVAALYRIRKQGS